MGDDEDNMFYIYICIIFWLLFCAGCTHQRPTISPDARVVIKSPKKIINPRNMSEEEADRIWRETGVYRGLTDDEWMELMQNIEALRLQQ
jgi:hypothetical protein